jgi:hypothetical protein
VITTCRQQTICYCGIQTPDTELSAHLYKTLQMNNKCCELNIQVTKFIREYLQTTMQELEQSDRTKIFIDLSSTTNSKEYYNNTKGNTINHYHLGIQLLRIFKDKNAKAGTV